MVAFVRTDKRKTTTTDKRKRLTSPNLIQEAEKGYYEVHVNIYVYIYIHSRISWRATSSWRSLAQECVPVEGHEASCCLVDMKNELSLLLLIIIIFFPDHQTELLPSVEGKTNKKKHCCIAKSLENLGPRTFGLVFQPWECLFCFVFSRVFFFLHWAKFLDFIPGDRFIPSSSFLFLLLLL